ncbi:hypothetical protein REPUB_Repub17cG0040400 [Reevesia pubescens]
MGKQGWRSLIDPNSFVARVLKAKYFPAGSFLEAQIGFNPSFTWRSILSVKSLVEKGLKWRVRNGKTIRVWNDRWISYSNRFGPIFEPWFR